jgi:hypothetical protein
LHKKPEECCDQYIILILLGMKIMQELEVQVSQNVNFRQLRDSYAYYSPERNPSPRQESNTTPIY